MLSLHFGLQPLKRVPSAPEKEHVVEEEPESDECEAASDPASEQEPSSY